MTKTSEQSWSKFQNLRFRLLLWIYKTILFFQAKQLNRIRVLSILILSGRIRINFKLPFMGEDDDLDEQIFLTIQTYLAGDESEKEINTEKQKYREWLDNKRCAEAMRNKVFQAELWFYSSFRDEFGKNEIDRITKLYRSLSGQEITTLDSTQIFAHIKELKRENKEIHKQLREGKIQKIEFPLKNLRLVLPVVSVFLTVSGYIYSIVYYGYFGIEVSLFFSLSDYLAASIEKIGTAFWSTIFFLVGALIGHIRNPTLSRLEHQRRQSTISKQVNILMPLVILGSILFFLLNFPIFYEFYLPILALLIGFVLWRNYCGKYLKNPNSDGAVLFWTFIFLVHLWGSAQGAILRLENGEQRPFKVETSRQVYDESNARLIGGNSQFLFLLEQDKKEKEILALPKSSLKSFWISKKSPSWSAQVFQQLRMRVFHLLNIPDAILLN